ncbi:MAG: periplasmic heavy metal sensor [Gemmatimonadota bacterium]
MERSGGRTRPGGRALVAGAIALLLAGLVALSAEARGWGRDGRAPSPDRLAARMADRLGLSADQEAKVREVLAESAAKRREIREEGRKKMEGLRAETETRLSEVLTPEQLTELRRIRESRRERRRDCAPWGGPGGGRRGGPPPERD